jgi:hypothetical protein
MTEYRIVTRYKSAEIRDRILQKGTSFAKAVTAFEKIQDQVKNENLAPYWDDVEIDLQAREVSEWTSISGA